MAYQPKAAPAPQQKKKPVLRKKVERAGFVNILNEEYFTADFLGTDIIEGKSFFVLKLLDHPRIIKMAAASLRKVAVRPA